jgi:methylmalonyl-CoA mutase C-terminal domain/subunit
MELLKQKGMSDVTVLLGGTIPEADIPTLKKAGIAEIFLPGTSTQDIVAFVRNRATQKTR